MKEIKTDIIPSSQTFYGEKDEYDLKSIAFFMATGFFPDNSTYYKGLKVYSPYTKYQIDDNGTPASEEKWFEWNYEPRDISFEQALDEFTDLFENIVAEQTADQKVILPLSGGLDSRSLATALRKRSGETYTYSYEFENSFNETSFGKKIADRSGFPFKALTIPKGYIWSVREELGEINKCYSEFTHGRQMAVIDQIAKLGDIFALGHWGDVLFDQGGIEENVGFDQLLAKTKKKVLKEGGQEMAQSYWEYWGLSGTFEQYLNDKISEMYEPLKIDHVGARLRAFKSRYWAPRWTSINLAVFESRKPMALPYYHDEMCRFICGIPEEYLANRQIQIEYIKRQTPELAKVEWQGHTPCNLYTYKDFHSLRYIPYRVFRKIKNTLSPGKTVLRNWENQFLGETNRTELKNVFARAENSELFSAEIASNLIRNFYSGHPKPYSHPLSMQLTLATFLEQEREDGK